MKLNEVRRAYVEMVGDAEKLRAALVAERSRASDLETSLAEARRDIEDLSSQLAAAHRRYGRAEFRLSCVAAALTAQEASDDA